jgi:hypothetical protein
MQPSARPEAHPRRHRRSVGSAQHGQLLASIGCFPEHVQQPELPGGAAHDGLVETVGSLCPPLSGRTPKLWASDFSDRSCPTSGSHTAASRARSNATDQSSATVWNVIAERGEQLVLPGLWKVCNALQYSLEFLKALSRHGYRPRCGALRRCGDAVRGKRERDTS